MLEKYEKIFKQLQIDAQNRRPLEPNSKVLVVDALNLFIRAFAANPATNEDGIHIGGIHGTLMSLGYMITTYKPTRVIICADGIGGSLKRKEIFPEYKANRKKHSVRKFNRQIQYDNDEIEVKLMKMQLSRIFEYFKQLPVSIILENHIEADDIIAHIVRTYSKSDFIVASTDKDFLQLCSDHCQIYSPTKKILYTVDRVYKEYNIMPQNLTLYRTIQGDKSDGIPGVKGWGQKTIMKKLSLLKDQNTIYNIEDIIQYAKDNKLDKIVENADILRRNYKLMQLKNVDISDSIKKRIEAKWKEKIPRFVKFKLQKMILEDKVFSHMRNSNTWLSTTFNRLDHFASLHNNILLKEKS